LNRKPIAPEWLAAAENSSGWRRLSAIAPNPPIDMPAIARPSRLVIVW